MQLRQTKPNRGRGGLSKNVFTWCKISDFVKLPKFGKINFGTTKSHKCKIKLLEKFGILRLAKKVPRRARGPVNAFVGYVRFGKIRLG